MRDVSTRRRLAAEGIGMRTSSTLAGDPTIGDPLALGHGLCALRMAPCWRDRDVNGSIRLNSAASPQSSPPHTWPAPAPPPPPTRPPSHLLDASASALRGMLLRSALLEGCNKQYTDRRRSGLRQTRDDRRRMRKLQDTTTSKFQLLIWDQRIVRRA